MECMKGLCQCFGQWLVSLLSKDLNSKAFPLIDFLFLISFFGCLVPTVTSFMTWWSTSTLWHTDPSCPTLFLAHSISKFLIHTCPSSFSRQHLSSLSLTQHLTMLNTFHIKTNEVVRSACDTYTYDQTCYTNITSTSTLKYFPAKPQIVTLNSSLGCSCYIPLHTQLYLLFLFLQFFFSLASKFFSMSPFEPWTTPDKVDRVRKPRFWKNFLLLRSLYNLHSLCL